MKKNHTTKKEKYNILDITIIIQIKQYLKLLTIDVQ